MSPESNNSRPTVIGIGGLTSEVGKTTLLCKLLQAFPGWEAIKTTRGHYRSCGKDPHSCCVSDLLSSEPTVISGRELTYAVGKDTGRYWDAGAANVHWVIATDEQVEAGINEAFSRVDAEGVFIEGNSFTEFLKPDFFVMVARPGQAQTKATARRALKRVSAIYFSGMTEDGDDQKVLGIGLAGLESDVPHFSAGDVAALVERVRAIDSSFMCNAETSQTRVSAS